MRHTHRGLPSGYGQARALFAFHLGASVGYTIPTVEPTKIIAGDSLQWDRTLEDHPPSDGWSLSYALTGAEATVLEVPTTATADGAGYQVRVAPADSIFYDAGRYNLVGFVTHADGTRFEVYRAPCVVIADAMTAPPDIGHAERMVVVLQAKIADRYAADISGYSLEQQEVHREEIAQLERSLARYADASARQRGRPFFQNVAVSFVSPR